MTKFILYYKVRLSNFRKGKNSKFSENYKNIVSNLNFYFCEITVPTQIFNQIFSYEFGMQGLSLPTGFHDLSSFYLTLTFSWSSERVHILRTEIAA